MKHRFCFSVGNGLCAVPKRADTQVRPYLIYKAAGASPCPTMYLGFLDELFLALGAGDGDFSLSPGYTHRLAATGAFKVSMLPVF